MKKKILLTGMMVAAAIGVTACGSKQTTATESSSAASTEATAEASAEQTSAAESGADESSLAEADADAEDDTMEMNDVQSFAADIQDVVANKDKEGLKWLVSFPVDVTLEGGSSTKIEEDVDFMALDDSKLFSDKLTKAIAAADPMKVIAEGDKVVFGDEKVNITFGNVEDNLAIISINQ